MQRINQLFFIFITLLPITVYSNFNDFGYEAFNAGLFEQAILNWEKALEQFDSNNQNAQYIDTAVYLGIAYQTLGLSEQALYILENAKFRAKKINDQIRQANISSHLGDIYIAIAEWGEAETSLKQAENLATQIGSPLLSANVLNKQGNLWMARGNLKDAFKGKLTGYQKCLPPDVDDAETEQKTTTPECEFVGKFIDKTLKLYGLQCFQMPAIDECLIKTQNQEKFPHCIELVSINNKVRFTDKALQCLAVSQGIEKYKKSFEFAKLTSDKILAIKISLNLTQARIKIGDYKSDYQKAWAEIGKIRDDISALPDSHEKAFALIQLALFYQDMQMAPQFPQKKAATEMIAFNVSEQPDFSRGIPVPPAMLASVRISWIPPSLEQKNKFHWQSYQALTQAQQIAQSLGDSRTLAYAKGYLAQLYAKEKRYDRAIQLARRAIFHAQPYPYILYRWEWQLGKLFKQKKRFIKAIGIYQNAVEHLEDIRQPTLEKGYRNLSQPFRETDGQLYFEFADLLLEQAKKIPDNEKPILLKKARNQIELFKVAELENYFEEQCAAEFQKNKKDIDENLPPRTAVLYPIILAERVELLLSVGNKIQQFTIRISQELLAQEVEQFRQKLETTRDVKGLKKNAQQLYQWFIKPIEEILLSNDVNTLVIVPDGSLRTIPFAALHDGEQYLIQRYAIAVIPGMNSVDPTHKFRRDNASILAAGLSEKVEKGFPKLPDVMKELESICNEFYDKKNCEYIFLLGKLGISVEFRKGKILSEKDFTIDFVKNELFERPYSIVHFATHGRFESDSNDTYLLAYNDRMDMKDLRQLIGIRKFSNYPVELLVLSACQTARGDDKAALGLAGVAIKAGARSTLASLWSVSDVAIAQLMTTFYRHLLNAPNLSKAQALQKAQQELLKNQDWSHPYYWSAFLLIGNWL